MKKKNGFLSNIRSKLLKKINIGLKKTRDTLTFKVKNFFFNSKIDDCFLKELKERLLISDFGFDMTNDIINNLIKKNEYNNFKNKEEIFLSLKDIMFSIIEKNRFFNKKEYNTKKKPCVILVVGVNGVGKTTTIAKLANFYKKKKYSVMLSAADTFREAASDQLSVWGKKIFIPVISQLPGSDPASVVFNSIESAFSKNIDILIVDTAGRLHNKINLMKELQKIIRVIKKKIPSESFEVLLVLDACNGQNSILQTKVFHKFLFLNGIILTKLDSTAKGGVIFPIFNKFSIPIRYIGVGEKIDDLIQFNEKEYIEGIF